jgi:hypothetical protein
MDPHVDNENDSESDTESEHSDIDEILDEEEEFIDAEKTNGQYFIGIYKHIKPDNYLLLLTTISNRQFLQHSYNAVRDYLQTYSIVYVHDPRVEILKLEVSRYGTYTCIVKTFWIRLVQRRWRNILKMREKIWRKRCQFSSLRTFEITGKFPVGLRVMPGLVGMFKQGTYGSPATLP